MKRITILQHAHIPGDTPEQPEMVYAGSVLDLDDEVAGLLVVSGKARYETKDVKLRNTAAATNAALDEAAAKAALPPEAAMASLIGAAVRAALQPAGAPAA